MDGKALKVLVGFYLTRPKAITSSIYCKVSFGTKRPMRMPAGVSVLTTFWNSKKQRARTTMDYPPGNKINEKLDDLEKTSIKIVQKMHRRDPNLLRSLLQDHYHHGSTEGYLTIKKLFDDASKAVTGDSRRKSLESNGKQFRVFENYMIEHGEISKPYDVNDFTMQDFHAWRSYRLDVRYDQPGHLNKQIQNLSHVLEISYADGLHNNRIWMNKKRFKGVLSGPKKREVHLTPEKIIALSKVVAETEGEEIVRDLFCIQCVLMLRYSDASVEKGELIQKDDNWFVTVQTQKARSRVMLSIPNFVMGILQRYNMKPPKYISAQKTNEYIKALCKRAGFTEEVTRTETRGRDTSKVTYKFYELVATHTARRSAARNMISAGEDPKLVVKLGGWSTEKQMRGYLDLELEEGAEEMRTGNYQKLFN